MAEKTRRAYGVDLEQLAQFARDRGPTELRPADLRRFAAHLSESGMTKTSVARKLAAVRTFYRHLIEIGEVGASPADLVASPKRDQYLPQVLKPAEIAAVLDGIPASSPLELRDRAMFELAYAAGLRAEEIVNLDLTDLDPDDEELRVEGKGGRTRIVPAGEHAWRAIESYLDRGRTTLATEGAPIEPEELWRRYKEETDQRARERLVLAYSPLVKYVAGRMGSGLPAHVEESDLISYGLLGLISAIERFDPGREIKFETFAITRIKGSIIDELRSLDWVPRSVRAKAREIEKANAKLEHQLHRAPTDQEMAEKLGVSVDEFQDTLNRISNSSVVALDELWTVSDASGDQVSLLDTIQDPQALDPAQEMDASEMKDRLADAIARLPEREKLVVALYYYENLTLREIGEVLGVAESRVSQLHTKAVLRLKSRLQAEAAEAGPL